MNQEYMILGIAVIVLFILVFAWKKTKNIAPRADTDTTRPSENLLPGIEVPNDKIVIVENVSEPDISKIIHEFCNSYNKESYQALPRLVKLRNNLFAITFPFDISFDIFCYFINYVNYPMGFERHFNTIGWATTTVHDIWISREAANKNVMMFVSDIDTGYDNVFLTTSDNVGYKLGFAMGEGMQLLDYAEKNYVKPASSAAELSNKESIQFK